MKKISDLPLTPDGKTLTSKAYDGGDGCLNKKDRAGYCRSICHARVYQEIADLRAAHNEERLRRDMTALLIGPQRAQLTAFAFSLAKNWLEAEELVQEACFRAFKKAGEYRGSGLASWLNAIIRNTFIDLKRRGKILAFCSLDEILAGDFPVGDMLADPADSQEERLLKGERLDLLARLPLNQREAITVGLLDDVSYQEAADRLKISLPTFKSRFYRGAAALRQMGGK